MPAPLCSPDEVAETLGVDPYTGAEETQVARLCAQVSGLIRARRPQVDAWLTAGRPDPDLASGVACQVVARVKTTISTGGGAIRSETHPEYGNTLSSTALSGLALTDDELALLTPPAEDQEAFTIRPGAEAASA
jgi:hypothetical protein